ncbi:CheR family methyltransferase [Paraburkholderia sp. JHI2823]|uniref:CheR family methyltransferase n=1 Tax=Paraburkholderia sp. JHI2823 TaxID=3112960 RepID=UPI00317C1726
MAEPYGLVDDMSSMTPIVAIGASAGGITALQKLFETLPARLPYAFVVLQHLPTGECSRLGQLVAGWTSMPVLAAADGTVPQPRCVYLPSPAHILTIEHGAFRTRPADGGGRRPGIDTIDTFLESLARHAGPRHIAVILSGTGMDGTAGAICIREADGVVIVQDPLTATHDGMPNAVMQRGIHDHVLTVGAIGHQLVACADPRYTRPERSVDWKGEMSGTLGRIIDLIRQRSGFDLSGYKPSPLFWRIQQRMDTRKIWAFDDYASLVEDDPVELEALMRGIPIHVTEFFRDAKAWEVLRSDVLVPLITNAGKNPVRVWTPACSTGEEAYSVAMLLDEISDGSGRRGNFQIFATDAAPELVAKASRGVFRADALAAISAARRTRFFYQVDSAFRVKRHLRERLVFAPHDLLADPPFSGLHLITCRNLLFYLEPESVNHVLHVLHGALRMGGFLFLGKSEPYSLERQAFATVSREWKIYRKVGQMSPPRRPALPKPAATIGPHYATALRVALEQFHVPCVLIDDEGSVLRVYGEASEVLSLPAGEPTLSLPELVPRQWSAHLRLSIQQAFAERVPVTLTGLYDRGTGKASLSVRLTPLQTSEDAVWDRMLVSFIRGQGSSEHPDDGAGAPELPAPQTNDSVDWQNEFRVSREELEASKEELLALNEELQASNEQLNESNEDLNEANCRLQANIGQLAMQSRVLLSGAIMTMFLDRKAELRWFTPAMCELFPLTSNDIGRNIEDLVPRFRDRTFVGDIRSVLDGAEPREAVVNGANQRCFLRKTWPYISEVGAIAGVAVTYADITERNRAESALRLNEAWLSAQNEAFKSAMNGASLDASLGILIRALVTQADDARRCAFYIADGDVLRHVVGMSDDYARCVDGFRISPESLACGLAVATGTPVITRDVLLEPRWEPWRWLAQRFGYRGCWSFPVETSEGNLVGSLAMYFEMPREPSPLDRKLATAFAQTAAIISWRHLQVGRPGHTPGGPSGG